MTPDHIHETEIPVLLPIGEARRIARRDFKAALDHDVKVLRVEITDFQLTDMQYTDAFVRRSITPQCRRPISKRSSTSASRRRSRPRPPNEVGRRRQCGARGGQGAVDARLLQAQAEAKAIALQGEAQTAAIRAQANALATRLRPAPLLCAHR
jgi:regulator of protease activity HflC (stomatin/prohibitin superfamily)